MGDKTMTTNEAVTVCGCEIHVDKSGVGHCWAPATEYDCPANIQEEIAAKILDGRHDDCDAYVASNGMFYRW
jgi:hypothetical protein